MIAVQVSVTGLYLLAAIEPSCHRPAPHNHFATRPDCGVAMLAEAAHPRTFVIAQLSVQGLYLAPRDRALRIKITPAPYDHFATGPHCGVAEPHIRRIYITGRSPRIVRASLCSRNFWQLVNEIVALIRRNSCPCLGETGFSTIKIPLKQNRPCETLRHHQRIVAKRFEEVA